MSKILTEQEIAGRLEKLPGWRLEDGSLVSDHLLPDFGAALEFVNQIAVLAEQAGHHPDIDIRYNRVRLALVSHDVGGVTDRDTDLACRISGI